MPPWRTTAAKILRSERSIHLLWRTKSSLLFIFLRAWQRLEARPSLAASVCLAHKAGPNDGKTQHVARHEDASSSHVAGCGADGRCGNAVVLRQLVRD